MNTKTLPDVTKTTDFKQIAFPYEELDENNDHLTHIVSTRGNSSIWSQGMLAQDVVDLARMTGQKIVALCGYKWVPTRNPAQHPVCQRCIDLAGIWV